MSAWGGGPGGGDAVRYSALRSETAVVIRGKTIGLWSYPLYFQRREPRAPRYESPASRDPGGAWPSGDGRGDSAALAGSGHLAGVTAEARPPHIRLRPAD